MSFDTQAQSTTVSSNASPLIADLEKATSFKTQKKAPKVIIRKAKESNIIIDNIFAEFSNLNDCVDDLVKKT